jgi:hypothetical protein
MVLAAAPSGTPGAPPIGYAQATGYYKKDSRPTLYQPLNLLDAREITSWCSTSADHLADTLYFGFKGLARIDEVRIYTGNGFDEQVFREFGRGHKLALKAGGETRILNLEDHRGLQPFSIEPPLEGREVTLEVLDVYPAEDDPDVPVCLTDVVFYSGGKALNGAWLTQKLKYDRDRAALMGTWFAGFEGSPDRSLSFFYDDTYVLIYEPFEQATKRKVASGDYNAQGSHLTLEVPGKGRVGSHLRREQKGSYYLLTLDGNLPEDYKQVFRSKR